MFTGDQKLGFGIGSLTLVILLIAAAAGVGGCAGTVREALGVPSQEEMNARFDKEAQARKQGFATVGTVVKAVNEQVQANTTAIAEVRGGVTAAGEKLVVVEGKVTANTGGIEMLKLWASGVDSRLTRTDSAIGAHATAITGTKSEIAKVKQTANTAVAKATALTRRVGNTEDVAARGNVRVVQLLFASGRADKDGNITAGTSILPATEKATHELVVTAVEGGEWYVAEIVGYADSRPFVESHGRIRSDSDALNMALAEARAEAVNELISEKLGANAGAYEVSGAGTTTRYGSHLADRSAIVVMRRVQP